MEVFKHQIFWVKLIELNIKMLNKPDVKTISNSKSYSSK